MRARPASPALGRQPKATRAPLWFQALLLAGVGLLLALLYLRHLAPATVQSPGERLHENSGIVAREGGGFWSIADSGAPAMLYRLNQRGDVLARHAIQGAQNQDWEAIATDGQGRIFAGDVGDNHSRRKTLAVYEVALGGKTSPTLQQTIAFSYPPSLRGVVSNFDAESMVYLGGHLYVFTKRRADTQSEVYRVQAKATQTPQVASLVAKVQLAKQGTWFNVGTMATDAALAPGAKALAILTYRSVLVFEDPSLAPMPLHQKVSAQRANARIRHLLERPAKRLDFRLGLHGQCEGLAWSQGELFLSNEAGSIVQIRL